MFPVSIDLEGKKVLVVGGGEVACRRVEKLLSYGAFVHLVAPHINDSLLHKVKKREISWNQRIFEAGDVEGVWLCFAHTDSSLINKEIAEICSAHHIFCLQGGNPDQSDLWMMATSTTSTGLTVAASSQKNPRRSIQAVKRFRVIAETEDL